MKASRDEYVALHVESPERTEKMINALPKLDPSHVTAEPPENGGQAALSSAQRNAAKALGISEEDYKKTLDAERETREAL